MPPPVGFEPANYWAVVVAAAAVAIFSGYI